MNPLCPNCQAELPDDFGLVDCNSCGAVCSIDLEDNVTVQGDDVGGSEEEYLEENSDVISDDELGEYENLDQDENEEESEDDDAVDLDDSESGEESLDYAAYSAEDENDLEENEDSDAQSDEGENENEEIDLVEDLSFEDPVVPVSLKTPKPLNGEDFLKELEVFSDEATADGGHIYYDFHVTGIEGGQLRENFIETIADARLEISEDAVREFLGDSVDFTLPQISFLRLTVIYKRLLSLGLNMSWSLSELQEPVSYLSEEIEEVGLYGDDDSAVYEESEGDEDY